MTQLGAQGRMPSPRLGCKVIARYHLRDRPLAVADRTGLADKARFDGASLLGTKRVRQHARPYAAIRGRLLRKQVRYLGARPCCEAMS